MNLGELIQALKGQGAQFTSWYGIETNVESVSPAIHTDGIWKVELKIKDEQK